MSGRDTGTDSTWRSSQPSTRTSLSDDSVRNRRGARSRDSPFREMAEDPHADWAGDEAEDKDDGEPDHSAWDIAFGGTARRRSGADRHRGVARLPPRPAVGGQPGWPPCSSIRRVPAMCNRPADGRRCDIQARRLPRNPWPQESLHRSATTPTPLPEARALFFLTAAGSGVRIDAPWPPAPKRRVPRTGAWTAATAPALPSGPRPGAGTTRPRADQACRNASCCRAARKSSPRSARVCSCPTADLSRSGQYTTCAYTAR
ncbi:hypothetical protein SHIRM173S_09225 [Streptomyces hirsutus]